MNNRASPRERRSPRFDVTSACSSSSTIRLAIQQIGRIGRGQDQRELLGCREQDLRRVTALRWRFEDGVSPVRVSIRIGSPISATGRSRFRAMSTASALSGEM